DLDEPPTSHAPCRGPDDLQRLVRGATGTKAIREVVELLLVDLPDHHRHRTLQDLVLEGRDADRTGFRTVSLRDVHSPHRRRPVPAGLRALEKRLEVVLQSLRVLLRAHSVDARGTVLSRATIGLTHPVHVDVVRQRLERGAPDLPGQVRYSFELG